MYLVIEVFGGFAHTYTTGNISQELKGRVKDKLVSVIDMDEGKELNILGKDMEMWRTISPLEYKRRLIWN